jgi:hypothetical protein
VWHLEIGPLHNYLGKRCRVNPVRKDKLNTMFEEKYALVKTILPGYPSDY